MTGTPIFRTSEISFIEITGQDTIGRQLYHDFIVSNGTQGHRLSFSTDALRHIQSSGYVTSRWRQLGDFTHFDTSKSLLVHVNR